jgi:ribosomal protein S18 acetylase RimI-like enzyme
MNHYEIVEINHSDENIKALQSLSNKTFSDTFSEGNKKNNLNLYISQNFCYEKLSDELNTSHSKFYFIEHNNEKIGYLKLNYVDAQADTHDFIGLEIQRIYVLKKFQGKGAGKMLYNKAIELAKSAQLAYLWLGVWEKNMKAIRFYEQLGFEIFAEHEFKFGSEIQTDKLMKVKI